jgi:hypothetical protein
LTAGGAMLAGQVTVAISTFLALAARLGILGLALLLVGQILFNAGLQIFSMTQISVRKAVTPRHLLVRVNGPGRVGGQRGRHE